jgi:hypothetical protein
VRKVEVISARVRGGRKLLKRFLKKSLIFFQISFKNNLNFLHQIILKLLKNSNKNNSKIPL